MNIFSYDLAGNPIDTYICNYIMAKTFDAYFVVRYISFQPISIVKEGNRFTFNSFDEVLSLFGQPEYINYFEEITEEQFYKID